MIGGGELVLDDERRVVSQVATQQVKFERTSPMLALDELQVDLEGSGERIAVLQQRRCEVSLLQCPDLKRVDLLKATESDLVAGRSAHDPAARRSRVTVRRSVSARARYNRRPGAS
jgi:hypothetical protein